MLEAELVEAARDDEVDEVADRLRPVVEARRGEEDHRARLVQRRRPRRWIDESGVSRGTSTSVRRSFSATEAARWIRFAIAPVASVPTVDIEHGQMT